MTMKAKPGGLLELLNIHLSLDMKVRIVDLEGRSCRIVRNRLRYCQQCQCRHGEISIENTDVAPLVIGGPLVTAVMLRFGASSPYGVRLWPGHRFVVEVDRPPVGEVDGD
jgi:hypothetical protein